jgi:hypothetical protein
MFDGATELGASAPVGSVQPVIGSWPMSPPLPAAPEGPSLGVGAPAAGVVAALPAAAAPAPPPAAPAMLGVLAPGVTGAVGCIAAGGVIGALPGRLSLEAWPEPVEGTVVGAPTGAEALSPLLLRGANGGNGWGPPVHAPRATSQSPASACVRERESVAGSHRRLEYCSELGRMPFTPPTTPRRTPEIYKGRVAEASRRERQRARRVPPDAQWPRRRRAREPEVEPLCAEVCPGWEQRRAETSRDCTV